MDGRPARLRGRSGPSCRHSRTEAVRGAADVIVTAEDGHRAVAMGVAAQMAAVQSRVVSMQEVGL